MRYDDVIVGGGTAGCVVAARLSEDLDRAVCLVEAGPDYGPLAERRWPTDMLTARFMPKSHDWGTGAEDGRSLGARIIGGCSAHNACCMLAGTPADYDAWGPQWAWDVFEPYLARAKTELRAAPVNTERRQIFHTAVLEAAQELGFPLLTDPNDPAQPIGVAPFTANVVDDVRWNTAFGYLDAARGRPNLTVLAETLVDRLVMHGGRAVGVATSRGAIEANRVVLTAGAYFSPAILMRSGVGPEAELRRLGAAIVADLPVGRQLLDHYGFAVVYEPAERLHAALAASEPVFEAQVMLKAASSICPPGTLDLHAPPWANPLADEPGRYEVRIPFFLMQPRSRGRVRVTSLAPDALPVVESGFLTDATDVQPLLDGLELARELAATRALRDLLTGELAPGDAEPEAFIREHVTTYYHPVGTCPMGSVVEAAGRVLGLDNVFVADASIMPTIPRANTNLTVVAVAERLAELLRAS